MKRIQLFEFEDFHWFPEFIRNSMTKLIVVFHKMMGTSETLSTLFTAIKKKHSFDQIIDLGSGAGGAMPEAIRLLNETSDGSPTKLILTDLHPNQNYIDEINRLSIPNVTYSSKSVDATKLANTPAGLKTMIASFHHMPPEQAKSIMRSAQESKTPFLILEITENNIPTILWWLLLPLSLTITFIMCLVLTLFVRPLTWQQLLFTYLIPIIPICYAWDGQASLIRTYTFDDIKELLPDTNAEGYTWEMKIVKNKKGRKAGYIIQGLPN